MDLWLEWLGSGSAFLLAIIGWIWQAGRLVTRLDAIDKRLNEHLNEESIFWKENSANHDRIVDKVEAIAADLAYLEGKSSRNGSTYNK